jgi:hypothetical protein
MSLLLRTHEAQILYSGRQLQSEICFNIQLISVVSFCHNLSWKSKFTTLGGWKRGEVSKQHTSWSRTTLQFNWLKNLVGKFALTLNHSQYVSTVHFPWFRRLLPRMSEWTDFSANYFDYCFVENIPETSFAIVWHAQLYDVVHLCTYNITLFFKIILYFIETNKLVLFHALVTRHKF